MARTQVEKSVVITGAGWIGSLAGALTIRLKRRGWSMSDIHGLINEVEPETPEFDSMIDAMVEAVEPKGTIILELTSEDIASDEDVVPGIYALTFEPLFQEKEVEVSLEVMLERAKQRHAKSGISFANALTRQMDKIPRELLGRASLIFAGGVKESGRFRYVPCFVSHAGKWTLVQHWFDIEKHVGLYDDRKDFYRLVRARKRLNHKSI